MTHVPPQFVSPAWQVTPQVPAEQTLPAGQAFPQAPQLDESLAVAVQIPLQQLWLAGQAGPPPQPPEPPEQTPAAHV